ncbi:MAG: response regulator transcription factor, partial [Anaerolineales bacterium]
MEPKVRVLIADDNQRTRRALRAILHTSNELVVIGEASNGQELLDLMQVDEPDVVVIDGRMPCMAGIEVAQRIKSDWPTVKIIMLSMHAGYQKKALEAGVDFFIVKGTSA